MRYHVSILTAAVLAATSTGYAAPTMSDPDAAGPALSAGKAGAVILAQQSGRRDRDETKSQGAGGDASGGGSGGAAGAGGAGGAGGGGAGGGGAGGGR